VPRKKTLSLIVAILLAAGYWVLENTDIGKGGSADSSKTNTSVGTSKVGAYEQLTGCTLVDHRHNDGDSFHVLHGEREYEFRLYFVDAPESSYKTYKGGDNNGERIRQQGDYFGGLSRDQTTDIGAEAKKLALTVLRGRPFTVYTKREKVYGSHRLYALVAVVDAAGHDNGLGDMLVNQGLARIHTKGAALPNGTSRNKHEAKLRSVEHAARKAGVGAWRFSRR
jgi:endonuclease YncB( thermonuclease family)